MEGGRQQDRISHSLVTTLRGVPSLSTLDEQTLLAVCGDSVNLVWSGGATVFEQGSPADGLYIVLSGRVRVLDHADGELSVLGPGEFFGEFSLLLGTEHQNGVEALEDTELMVVPKERFDALIASNRELGATIRRDAEMRLAANLGARPAVVEELGER